jgi:gliding motility-associated-like protein
LNLTRHLFITFFFCLLIGLNSKGQNCSNWLFTNTVGSSVKIGDLDVSGNKITIEAVFNRTAPWSGNYLYAGDLVSKHDLPNNVNYLLRPNNAEITTSNGYFATPEICLIQLNKTYHAALVYDGTTLKFYRNGFLMSQVAASGNLVNNNFITTIGDYAYPNPLGTNFVGFINEVRIWNVARTQDQIRNNMLTSLSNPTTQTGLMAYYTFNDLSNKQGNTTWNGVLTGTATINNTNTSCALIADSCNTFINTPVIINNYTPVISLDKCKNNIHVSDGTSFGIGDTVLLIQMQGADINISNNNSFGNINDYNQTGNYEFNYVSGINGNVITLLNNITRNYDLQNGKVQLVRVPYYEKLTVENEITCLPWDGEKGGVIAFEVRDTLVLNANINASNYGFRGGLGINTFINSTNCGQIAYTYPSSSTIAAEKGEGISIVDNAYNKGRGAPANAGGGGQDHNSGGGGGGNGGVGGFGGFQWLDCSGTVDNRGIGGKSLLYNNSNNKIFMGGGGGAGHCNNIGFNSSGGNGGGIIIIKADKVISNSNHIESNGGNGAECVQNGNFGYCHEGMGGGGAGGTILLDVNQFIDNMTISAKGGKGADMNGENIGSLGPGGGGSGGVTWFKQNSTPANTTTALSGGQHGVNTNIGNAINGATVGSSGLNLFDLVLPVDITTYSPNIDSVRISRNQTSCTGFQFNAQGFTRSNPIINWEWNFGDGNTSTNANPSHVYSTPGSYTVKLYGADVNGCIDSSELSLNIVEANVAVSSDQQFCSNGPVSTSVSAIGNGTISWSPAVLFNNPASSTPTVTLSNTTKLYVTSTLSPGCSARDSLTITVNPLPFTNVSQSICPAQLPFTWNSQNITSGGNYIALLTSAAGCDSTVSLNLTIEDTIRSFNQLTICSNQSPFNWNGQSLTTTGTYRAELTNTSNCDSVATLNLTINPVSNSLSNETICSSQIPYTWNGQSITSSGNYQVVLMNSLGCDSIARLNLSLQPSSTSNSAQTICSNATPFNWNGQSFNSSGNYSVSLTAANGCDSIANLNLTVNPVRSSNTNASICSGALPYNWNGLTINSSGTYTSNLTSANGCDSIATLQLQVNSIVTSTTQRSICTAQLPYTWNGLTLNGPGSYTANLISQAGCDSLATIELQVGNSVTSSISEEICNSSFPYSWNGLNIQTPGNYNATLTSNNGCDSIVTLTLTVKPSPPFNTIPDTAICRGTTLRLTTSSGFTNYQWTPGNLVNDSTTSNPLYSGINPTQMLVVSAIDPIGGCLISDTVMVTNRQLPLVTATPDTAVCSNSPTVLSATGANTYQWSPSTYLSNPSVNNPVFSSSTGMVYIVSGSDNFGCKGTDTVAVSIRTPNNLAPPPDKAMCKGQEVELDGANGSNYQYVWSPASYLSNSNVINPIATPTATTTYTVTIKDLLCSYERNFEVDVTVYTLPNVSIQKSNNINCSQKTARLTASGASQYQWQPDPTLSSTSIRNPIASPTATTQYVVVGTDVRGCSNSDTITVTAMGVLEAYAIPNAFTPNGDGLNDCFGIRKWGDARNVYFVIYNRWGDLVFETRDMNECWDGNYKGKQANAGNYVFYVIADTPCGKMNKKGNVILIR